jgi:hypothetical protein
LLRKVTLVRGRRLRIRGDAGLALDAALGAVAIRVTTGSLRSCAVFDGESIRRDVAGTFFARDTSVPALLDCTDTTLLSAIGFGCGEAAWPVCDDTCPGDGVCTSDVLGGSCRCVFPTQPCGGTAPACNGECPAGEQCFEIDDFIPGPVNACACAPVGEPPCGATGQACDVGGCPAGHECDLIPGAGIYDSQCVCVEPDATCGPGYGDCPPDLECAFVGPGAGGNYQCVPILCGTNYPACDSDCSGGRECVPLAIGAGQLCVCATPTLSCDDGGSCGGFTCPAGHVCTIESSSGATTCSCEPA